MRTLQQSGGAGLGLSIARSLVEAQGGQIEIASKLNVGTAVTLSFPIASAPRVVSGGASAPGGGNAAAQLATPPVRATAFGDAAEAPHAVSTSGSESASEPPHAR